MRIAASQSDELADLAARQAIATNLARHSRGVDRNDVALLASAYHPGAQVSYGMFDGPAADMAAFLTGAMLGQPVTSHRTGNMWIETAGDRARSESYVIACLRTPAADGASIQRLIGGRYLDRHERRDGAWKIVHRTYVLEWNSNRPSTEKPPGGSAAPLTGFAPRGAQLGQDPGTTLLAIWTARRTSSPAREANAVASTDLDAMLARDAIHRLSVAYCRGADRADAELLASVFHPDATFVGGGFSGSAADFAKAGTDHIRANLKSSFHSIANAWVEVDGDRAIGEIYVLAFTRTDGGAEGDRDSFIGGRYLDRYERRDGAWRIAERVFVEDWTMNHLSTHEDAGMYAELPTRGGYKPADPIYAFWTS